MELTNGEGGPGLIYDKIMYGCHKSVTYDLPLEVQHRRQSLNLTLHRVSKLKLLTAQVQLHALLLEV